MIDRLVTKLSEEKHPILFEPRTEDINEIKERLKSGFVFVRFTDTQGGTELGITVDSALTDIDPTIFEKSKSNFKLVGTCELNFHKVRCIAEIDLPSQQGFAQLELLND